jgi:polysaccharide biosynthesis/export protein
MDVRVTGSRRRAVRRLGIGFALLFAAAGLRAQSAAPAAAAPPAPVAAPPGNYIVGPKDVLAITSYDQADLSGKFTVEADGTFTFPLLGRFKAGGLTLEQIERQLKRRLVDEGYFKDPQVTVAIDQYKSQKIHVIGEVRQPGTYALSGDMSLVEALALAGSTLPTAAGEVVIVHGSGDAPEPTLPEAIDDPQSVVRVNLRDLQNGAFAENTTLQDGDTVFVPRAESVYVFGQVKNPGAYPLQQQDTTVLQALALAGGVTDRGATGRISIVRNEGGKTREFRVHLTDTVRPGDTITVPERFF